MNLRELRNFLIMLSISAVIAWQFGYWCSQYSHSYSHLRRTPTSLPTQTTLKTSQPSPLPITQTNLPVENPKQSLQNNEIQDSHYQELVEKRGLKEKSDALAHVFSNTPIGQALVQASTFLKWGPYVQSDESAIVSHHLEYLKSNPTHSFEEIKSNIMKMDINLTYEKNFLIQFAAKLDVDSSLKMNFLTEQLLNSTQPSTSDTESRTALVVLSSMINISKTPEEVEPHLRKALIQQKDPTAQALLLSTFATKFPENAKKLKAEFSF